MSGRVWLGFLFLLFGLGLLLHQVDVIDLSQLLSDGWPLILIIIGMIQLINRKHTSPISGLLFLIIGLLFLVNQWLSFDLTAFIWPLIFIFIGFIFIFTRVTRGNVPHTGADLDTFVLFSGTNIRPQSENFQGGSVTVIFGGAEIDLSEAIMAEGASINITTLMGGAEITIPENVQVEVSGTPIFGGIEDKTRVREKNEGNSTLKINCLSIFGGVEIKN